MTVYQALVEGCKQHPCEPSNPCCEEPCDEPSFWDLLPQCRLNWIALGLAAVAIGFGLIGLGYINIDIIANSLTNIVPPYAFDTTYLTQGSRLIAIFLAIILVSAWILFKACSDDWNIVVVGSLVGASGFPLAAIGLLYFTVAQFDPTVAPIGTTWFDIARPLIIASIVGFLLLAYRIHATFCQRIDAKKAVIVSLIFLSGGWAAWSLGRLLDVAVITFRYSELPNTPPSYVFPSTAFSAFIFVSIINIALVLVLGWYVLNCAADNCFTAFLPLFASAASLGNWTLYRVGLNVLSYIGDARAGLPAGTPLTQFAIATGLISVTALILTFKIANCPTNFAVLVASSAIPLLHAIATYTFAATADNLVSMGDFVNSILQGIFLGIALTAALVFFLRCRAKCPIPNIIYGLASGTFGWAIIYLYSIYSSDILGFFGVTATTNMTTLAIGLVVIVSVAAASVLYIQRIVCDELLSAITFVNVALLTVGAAGLIGTVAYNQDILNSPDITAAVVIYVIFVLVALLVPHRFAKCTDVKRKLVIAVASLAFGIAATDFGRAVVFARAVAFVPNIIGALVDFSTLVYIASVFGAVLVGQSIVWTYPQANLSTALLASFVGLVAGGIAMQVTILVDGFLNTGAGLIATPWLVFTLGFVALLAYLELKSLCIPQHCRFLPGLLIPALGIAVFGRVAGASAVLGTVYAFTIGAAVTFLSAFFITSRLIVVNSIIPLTGFFLSLKAFECTSSLAYLPSCISYIAVVYAASQFEILNGYASPGSTVDIPPPLLNFITSVYFVFDLSSTDLTVISPYVTFITQTGFVYILFLAPALIAGFAFSCCKPVSAAVLGASIAATLVSFGAFGVANVIFGVLLGIARGASDATIDVPITNFISFATFLTGIKTQFVLLVVGVLLTLFILCDMCKYRSC